MDLTRALKTEAARLGFDLVGVCPAVSLPGFARFREWVSSGKAAGMEYLAAQCAARENPRHVLAEARSILMLGMSYRNVEPIAPAAGQGAVARYAWGRDYHEVIRSRLRELRQFYKKLSPRATARGIVDTAPLLEREFARLAGLGGIGRNTMLINRRLGSYFFLAAMLVSDELSPDKACEEDLCGNCRACIDACPSGALGEKGMVDARRCISYLTIEHRGPIAAELRECIGSRVFGCDACQAACPWNIKAAAAQLPASAAAFQPGPGMNPLDLHDLSVLDDAAFRERFKGMSFLRAKREGMLRNAAIVLGNQGTLQPPAGL